MEELKDRSKRLVKLTVFDWNPKTKEFGTYDLAAWDRKEDIWRYSSFIPDRVLSVLDRYAPAETSHMQKLLENLSLRYPIKG